MTGRSPAVAADATRARRRRDRRGPRSGMPVRIAVVAAGLEIVGGQSVQARALTDGLRSDGYDVVFIPINRPFPTGLRWLRRYRYVRTVLNQSLYLQSLLRLRGADVVHIFSASYWSFVLAPVPAILAARALGKRTVLHYHSGEAETHQAHWGHLVHPWLRLADELVVPSDYLRAAFAHHGYHARVIPNVVDASRFRYRERSPLRPRLLSTRNLESYYRVDNTLEAFALVRARHREATLTIAGSGRAPLVRSARSAWPGGRTARSRPTAGRACASNGPRCIRERRHDAPPSGRRRPFVAGGPRAADVARSVGARRALGDIDGPASPSPSLRPVD